MKFLLTNDDGIDAPGLAALEAAAREFGEVVVCAPLKCYSGCGHQTTTASPLRIDQRTPNRFAIDGTPADCVRVGLLHLAKDIDFVLSGVNCGGNLGVDMYMSGTVAAAREAMLLGVRAIALSQYRKSREFSAWEKTFRMTSLVLERLLNRDCPPRRFWNVNFPDVPASELPEAIDCAPDPHPLPVAYETIEERLHYRGNYHARRREAKHDVDVCFSGNIAVSLITHG